MRAPAALAATALILAACGPKALALPDDPIDRAATCGIVAAAKARAGMNSLRGDLPFDAELGVIHYSLLAGAGEKGTGFARDKASAVAKRMATLADKVTAGKWQTLEQPCAQAYPATAPTSPPKLPTTAAQSQLGCYVLADFLRTALQSQDASYGEQLSQLGELRRALDPKLAGRFAAKGQTDIAAQKDPRDEALADMTRRGPPGDLIKLCIAAYPPPKSAL
ncbi:MAG: hypothetical protein JOY99_14085 [Sphingomonadaceae bacterium]|nr:hypothetical protein [Sphingomonadaceae bacterium]